MTSRTRWAVLGTGYIAETALPDLQRTENVDVVAVCSRDDERAARFAERWGIPHAYGSYDALFAAGGFDVAYIGTPVCTHAPLARRALEAGTHVLVEKPFTLTADEASELASLARDRGLFLMEAMWTRFNPAIRAVTALIADGAIGDVMTVRADFGLRLHRITMPTTLRLAPARSTTSVSTIWRSFTMCSECRTALRPVVAHHRKVSSSPVLSTWTIPDVASPRSRFP